MTTNIPGREILDRREVGRLLSPIHEYTKEVNKMLGEDLQIAKKGDYGDMLKEQRQSLAAQLEGAPGISFPQLRRAEQAVKQAKTHEELIDSLQRTKAMLERLEGSKIGRSIARQSEEGARMEMAEYRRTRSRSGVAGWDAFIARLEGR